MGDDTTTPGARRKYTPEELRAILEAHKRWRRGETGEGSSRAYLSDANLSGANLSGANLSGANLSRAYLSDANLSGANLSDAYLSDANLSRAYLSDANLSDANLSDANLSGANLSRANLSGAYLSDANLSDANLSDANLSDANLSGANLSRAYLSDANLSGANLSDAYLSDANLSGAYLSDANLSGANLSRAYLSDANLSGANLSDAYLSGANLSGANLSDAYLSGADLSGVIGIDPAAPRTDPPTPYVRAVTDEQRAAGALERAKRYRERNPEVPVIDHLDARILGVIDTGAGALEMGLWHTCETTHCRAGWAIHLAGEAGYALERKLGDPALAGAAIYRASTGRVPNFYTWNDRALGDIKRCAAADPLPPVAETPPAPTTPAAE